MFLRMITTNCLHFTLINIVIVTITLFGILFFSFGQQTYREQSTIDVFGNKSPIFNYMPNPGHIDLERLNYYREHVDLREEEGSRTKFVNKFFFFNFKVGGISFLMAHYIMMQIY